MSFISQTIYDPYFWTLVAITALAFVWNAFNRAQWDVAWAPGSAPAIPERDWSYDAGSLESFARAAMSGQVRGQPALGFYVRILRGSDLAFAITLSALSTYIWYRLALSPLVPPLFNWMALPAGAMSIAYGIADVAEDLKLASILGHPDKVDPAEAAAANMLTRIKLTTISLSLTGLVLFVIYLVLVTTVTASLKALKKKAVVTG
jgi:hypothetical protein